jgi:hypothetical protein
MIKAEIKKITKKGFKTLFRVVVRYQLGCVFWQMTNMNRSFKSRVKAEEYAMWLIMTTPERKSGVW